MYSVATGGTANRVYKDSMFRDLFSMPENALSLYNTLNGSNYDDPSLVEITTLKDVMYLNIKNDVSFLIKDDLVLWEHQSSYNPNMPLRGLLYFGRLYSEWIERDRARLYSSSLLLLSRPRFAAFYNGVSDRPAHEVLRLSEAFLQGGNSKKEPCLEVVVDMYNVNEGASLELEESCEALAGYAHFVAQVREGRDNGLTPEAAVDMATERCIADGVLSAYLTSRRAEVKDMFLTEYDQELHERVLREEGRAEGREEMREEMLARVSALVRSGALDIDTACSGFSLSRDELAPLVRD